MNLIGGALTPAPAGPTDFGHPGLPLAGTFDPSLGLGTPSLLPHLETLRREPGFFLNSFRNASALKA